METIKKVLLVHGDQSASRTLTLLLAEAGYYVRSYSEPAAAIAAVQDERFDLSLVAESLPKMDSSGLVDALKTRRPGMAVVLLVKQLGLSSMINSIRMSVTDVLAPGDDWALVVRRINAILRPGGRRSTLEMSPEGIAEVEAILSNAGNASSGAGPGESRRVAEIRLREEAIRLRMGQIRLEREQRQLQEEMELLREQEANLRTYEQRLRAMITEAGDDRKRSSSPWMSHEPGQQDRPLDAAWLQVDRAADMLQAERRSFNDERLVLKEELARMRAREEELQKKEQSLAAREAQLAPTQVEAAPARATFSQAPLKAVKAIFTNDKK
jgi:DNA-binding response OmpR family regulator